MEIQGWNLHNVNNFYIILKIWLLVLLNFSVWMCLNSNSSGIGIPSLKELTVHIFFI